MGEGVLYPGNVGDTRLPMVGSYPSLGLGGPAKGQSILFLCHISNYDSGC